MDIKASVDIGSNLNNLIVQLAEKIGTTADKIFPWYVQQAYYDGLFTIIALVAITLMATIVFLINIREAGIKDDGEPNMSLILTIFTGMIFVCLFIVWCISFTTVMTQILNPEYHGLKLMIEDLSKLTH
jgi:hypothetical protein